MEKCRGPVTSLAQLVTGFLSGMYSDALVAHDSCVGLRPQIKALGLSSRRQSKRFSVQPQPSRAPGCEMQNRNGACRPRSMHKACRVDNCAEA